MIHSDADKPLPNSIDLDQGMLDLLERLPNKVGSWK